MADISDDQEVTEVELYIDGELVYIDNILEFFWLWDTADDYYPDGQYTIRISATDWNGNSAGDEINVELDNEVIPPIIEAEDVTPGSVNAGETTEVLFVVEITDVENVLEFVIIDLSQLGGPSEQLMYDDGTHGDKIPGDNIFSFEQEVSSEVLQGEKSMPVRLTYAEEESVDTSLILYVTLSETGEGQETGRDNDLDKLLPWLILVGAALIIVVVTAYLFSLNRRLVYHYEEALEVEPIYYYDQ